MKAVPAVGPEALLLGARIERRLGDRAAMLELWQSAAPALPFGAGDQGISRRTLLMSSQEPDNSGVSLPADPERAPEAGRLRAGRPGAQLLAERRAQGLSLGDVARQLKLSVRQVEALERDEYAALPGPGIRARIPAQLRQAAAARPGGTGGAGRDRRSRRPRSQRLRAATPVPLQESGSGRRQPVRFRHRWRWGWCWSS